MTLPRARTGNTESNHTNITPSPERGDLEDVDRGEHHETVTGEEQIGRLAGEGVGEETLQRHPETGDRHLRQRTLERSIRSRALYDHDPLGGAPGQRTGGNEECRNREQNGTCTHTVDRGREPRSVNHRGIGRHLDRGRERRTVTDMERDTREIFEELTRGVEEEISSRRARENVERRRRAPRLALLGALGVLATTLVGVRQPILGALLFLGLTWLLNRTLTKVLPDTGR